MAAKAHKLSVITSSLKQLSQFLYSYMPLINAHNTDFLTLDHWTNLIDPGIQKELTSLSDEQLAKLPSQESEALVCYDPSSAVAVDRDGGIDLMFYKDPQEGCVSRKPIWKHGYLPNWHHKTLEQLKNACQANSLPNLGILTQLDTLLSKELGLSADTSNKVIIETFMSNKKSHEVNIMADLCANLALALDAKRVIDIGSGRGYLGCHLSLMHQLQVLGVDSSPTNTSSADDRKKRLEKHWKGLIRNATEPKVTFPNRKNQKKKKPTFKEDSLDGNSVPNVSVESSEMSVTSPGSMQNVRVASKEDIPFETLSLNETTDLLVNARSPSESDCDSVRTKSNYVPVTQYITSDTDLMDLVCQYFPAADDVTPLMEKFMLTGLHTCGNLGASVMRLFTSNQDLGVLCNVGCCYHLIEEDNIRNPHLKPEEPDSTETGFPLSSYLIETRAQLGRNARMLAAQPLERLADGAKLPNQSLFWRALLQVMLRDVSGVIRDDWHVGRIASKCTDFRDYVHKCLKKLKMDPTTFTDDAIDSYMSQYEQTERSMAAFFQLKALFAPCIESLILLDRMAFLLEQPGIADAHLIRLFHPVTSPRCYAVVAYKNLPALVRKQGLLPRQER